MTNEEFNRTEKVLCCRLVAKFPDINKKDPEGTTTTECSECHRGVWIKKRNVELASEHGLTILCLECAERKGEADAYFMMQQGTAIPVPPELAQGYIRSDK